MQFASFGGGGIRAALAPLLFLPLALWTEAPRAADEPGPSGWYCAGDRPAPAEPELVQLGGNSTTLEATATAVVVHSFDSGCNGPGWTAFDGVVDWSGASGDLETTIATGATVSTTLTGSALAAFVGSGSVSLQVQSSGASQTSTPSTSFSTSNQDLAAFALVVRYTPAGGGRDVVDVISDGVDPFGTTWTVAVPQHPGPLRSMRLELTATAVLDAAFETRISSCHAANAVQTLAGTITLEL